MKKKAVALFLVSVLSLGIAACASGGGSGTSSSSDASEAKVLKLAESFAYPSLDAHKDYYGWYTSIYGLTETLFRVDDNLNIVPWLADGYTVSDDSKTWTITLQEKAAFSNGTALTADMTVRNFERLAEKNERFAYLADFTFSAADDRTLTITTPDVYPTLLSDLTAPETGIMDLDSTTDFVNAPVCTGPFVVKSFEPEGTVDVVKNTAYWDGEVKLDEVIFYYMQDDESKLDAMQSGEIDGYTSVTSAAKQIFAADPSRYTLTEIPATRLQFYSLNENRLDDNVRKAVNLTVDCEAIAAYLGGTVSAAVGPFTAAAPYGKVTKPAPDVPSAKEAMEAAGYTLNSDGFYAKDGQVLTLNICYYKARSLDTIALLMQEQLAKAGIDAKLTPEEDPDGTYIATGDYDIALYCMIADKAGDPYYCIDALFRSDSRWAVGGFRDESCEDLINRLQYETDPEERAALANQIVQTVIDDNAFGFVGLFNKTTVTAPGLTGIAENCPFDFYGVNADTTFAG